MISIALKAALRFLGAVLPGSTHGPVLIHQAKQVSSDASEQGGMFHDLNLATTERPCKRTLQQNVQQTGKNPIWESTAKAERLNRAVQGEGSSRSGTSSELGVHSI